MKSQHLVCFVIFKRYANYIVSCFSNDVLIKWLYMQNAGWTPVPQFGGWDQKGIDATDYSVVFTKARANRKLNKADVSHSLGSEQELMASARRHHYQQHLNNRRETQDDDPVMKKKRILTYINCCIRPN